MESDEEDTDRGASPAETDAKAESVREKTSVYRFGAVATRERKAAGARRYRIESVVWRKAGRKRLFIGERVRLSV